jgi:hypothetical protein
MNKNIQIAASVISPGMIKAGSPEQITASCLT